MKALIFSDIHFYNNPAKSYIMSDGRHSWFYRQIAFMKKLNKLAASLDVDLIIHNGDLFHEKTRINIGLYNSVWDIFKGLSDEGFEVILNTGNHDRLTYQLSSLKPFSKIATVITEPVSWVRDDTEFAFIPFGQEADNLGIFDHEGPNILFTHADIAGLKYGPLDYPSSAPLKPQIFKEWDIVFNGHVHKPQELMNIVNIGSPMITDWGEADEQKRVIFYKDGEWESICIPGPKFTHFDRLTDKLKKKIEMNEADYFRIDVDSEQLKDPIFDKFNIFPRVTKTKKRSLRLIETENTEEEIERYIEITETKLNKNELLRLGKEIYYEFNESS